MSADSTAQSKDLQSLLRDTSTSSSTSVVIGGGPGNGPDQSMINNNQSEQMTEMRLQLAALGQKFDAMMGLLGALAPSASNAVVTNNVASLASAPSLVVEQALGGLSLPLPQQQPVPPPIQRLPAVVPQSVAPVVQQSGTIPQSFSATSLAEAVQRERIFQQQVEAGVESPSERLRRGQPRMNQNELEDIDLADIANDSHAASEGGSQTTNLLDGDSVSNAPEDLLAQGKKEMLFQMNLHQELQGSEETGNQGESKLLPNGFKYVSVFGRRTRIKAAGYAADQVKRGSGQAGSLTVSVPFVYSQGKLGIKNLNVFDMYEFMEQVLVHQSEPANKPIMLFDHIDTTCLQRVQGKLLMLYHSAQMKALYGIPSGLTVPELHEFKLMNTDTYLMLLEWVLYPHDIDDYRNQCRYSLRAWELSNPGLDRVYSERQTIQFANYNRQKTQEWMKCLECFKEQDPENKKELNFNCPGNKVQKWLDYEGLLVEYMSGKSWTPRIKRYFLRELEKMSVKGDYRRYFMSFLLGKLDVLYDQMTKSAIMNKLRLKAFEAGGDSERNRFDGVVKITGGKITKQVRVLDRNKAYAKLGNDGDRRASTGVVRDGLRARGNNFKPSSSRSNQQLVVRNSASGSRRQLGVIHDTMSADEGSESDYFRGKRLHAVGHESGSLTYNDSFSSSESDERSTSQAEEVDSVSDSDGELARMQDESRDMISMMAKYSDDSRVLSAIGMSPGIIKKVDMAREHQDRKDYSRGDHKAYVTRDNRDSKTIYPSSKQHGGNDRNDRQRDPGVSQGPCLQWWTTGECTFGDRCRFTHADKELDGLADKIFEQREKRRKTQKAGIHALSPSHARSLKARHQVALIDRRDKGLTQIQEEDSESVSSSN